MEEPYSGVVGDDAHGDGLAGGHLDRVAAYGVRLALVQGRVQFRVVGRVVCRTTDELHLVSVQVATTRDQQPLSLAQCGG